MADTFTIKEHLLHPSRLQLGSDQRERRWDATVVSQFLLAGGKERVVCFVNASKVIPNVTGDAVKCGQRFRRDNFV